jgi:hypothetical protein
MSELLAGSLSLALVEIMDEMPSLKHQNKIERAVIVKKSCNWMKKFIFAFLHAKNLSFGLYQAQSLKDFSHETEMP